MKRQTRSELILDTLLDEVGPAPDLQVPPGVVEPDVMPETEEPDTLPAPPDEEPGEQPERGPWRRREITPGTEPRPKA